MVKTRNECQLTDYMSSRGKTCYGGLLRESIVPVKFLPVLLITLLVQDETPTRWLWYGLGKGHAAHHGT